MDVLQGTTKNFFQAFFLIIFITGCSGSSPDGAPQNLAITKSRAQTRNGAPPATGGAAEEPCTDEITIAWDANTESDIAGYTVYVTNTDTGEVTEIDVGNDTSTPLELPPGDYSITVTATNTAGQESEPATPISVTAECDDDDEPPTDDDDDGRHYDPETGKLTNNFESDDMCPGQVFVVQTSTDLQNWTDTDTILTSPFDEDVSVDTNGAPAMFMRLATADGSEILREPCSSSSSSMQSSESSESSVSSSESSDSSDSSQSSDGYVVTPPSSSSSSESTSSESSSTSDSSSGYSASGSYNSSGGY